MHMPVAFACGPCPQLVFLLEHCYASLASFYLVSLLNHRLSSFSKTPLKRLPGDAAVIWSLAKNQALAVEGTWVLTDFMMMNNQYLISLSFSFLLYQARKIIIVINTIIDFL